MEFTFYLVDRELYLCFDQDSIPLVDFCKTFAFAITPKSLQSKRNESSARITSLSPIYHICMVGMLNSLQSTPFN